MEIVDAIVKLMLGFESPKLDLYSLSYGPFSKTATNCPVSTIHTIQILGLIFGCEKRGIWISVLHGNYIYICKLDVGF